MPSRRSRPPTHVISPHSLACSPSSVVFRSLVAAFAFMYIKWGTSQLPTCLLASLLHIEGRGHGYFTAAHPKTQPTSSRLGRSHWVAALVPIRVSSASSMCGLGAGSLAQCLCSPSWFGGLAGRWVGALRFSRRALTRTRTSGGESGNGVGAH
jgi:hypothetical protein